MQRGIFKLKPGEKSDNRERLPGIEKLPSDAIKEKAEIQKAES